MKRIMFALITEARNKLIILRFAHFDIYHPKSTKDN